MNRPVKTFLLWLLMAALPLQGFAAAKQAFCGPSHHHVLKMNTAVGEHSHGNKALHDHNEGATSAHHSTAEQPVVADGSSDSHHKHQNSSCSNCAACCMGAVAPPSAAALVPVYADAKFLVISPALLVTGFIPAGLERPPKHISA